MQSPVEERFWERVHQRAEGCWEWGGPVTPNGYGRLSVRGRNRGAHRVAYELAVGPIPAGLDLDHLCRNRVCVRPDHLEPVTRSENMLRAMPYVARQQRTQCIYGHSFDATRPNGKWQRCRACGRETARRYRARKVAA